MTTLTNQNLVGLLFSVTIHSRWNKGRSYDVKIDKDNMMASILDAAMLPPLHVIVKPLPTDSDV